MTVVCDRYAFSGVAFSAAKGLDRKWCMGPDIGLPAPDLVVYLDIDAREAAKRGGGTFGSEIYEKIAFQNVVKGEFEMLKDMKWMQTNAMCDSGKIGMEVFRTVETLLASKRVPIGSLFKFGIVKVPNY